MTTIKARDLKPGHRVLSNTGNPYTVATVERMRIRNVHHVRGTYRELAPTGNPYRFLFQLDEELELEHDEAPETSPDNIARLRMRAEAHAKVAHFTALEAQTLAEAAVLAAAGITLDAADADAYLADADAVLRRCRIAAQLANRAADVKPYPLAIMAAEKATTEHREAADAVTTARRELSEIQAGILDALQAGS